MLTSSQVVQTDSANDWLMLDSEIEESIRRFYCGGILGTL